MRPVMTDLLPASNRWELTPPANPPLWALGALQPPQPNALQHCRDKCEWDSMPPQCLLDGERLSGRVLSFCLGGVQRATSWNACWVVTCFAGFPLALPSLLEELLAYVMWRSLSRKMLFKAPGNPWIQFTCCSCWKWGWVRVKVLLINWLVLWLF